MTQSPTRDRADIVTDILELVRTECHGVDASAIERIETRIRNDYGGHRSYVLKKLPVSYEEAEKAVASERSGPRAAKKLKIDKTTLYRILKHRSSQ